MSAKKSFVREKRKIYIPKETREPDTFYELTLVSTAFEPFGCIDKREVSLRVLNEEKKNER